MLFRCARAMLGWLAAALVCTSAHAQVTASLVSQQRSVEPGRPVMLALRLNHEPPWHTYWINAGTGRPTTLKLSSPADWSAGAFEWPTPILIKSAQGEVTGHGYDGVVYLPFQVTPTGEGVTANEITFKATASWLMCADVCIPRKQQLSLTMPVSTGVPQPDEFVQAQIASMPMPGDARGWKIAANRSEKLVTLHVAGADVIRAPHFFSEDESIQYDAAQEISSEQQRMTLQLQRGKVPQVPERLRGLLSYLDAAGHYRSVKVDVPFAAEQEAIAASAADPAELSLRIVLLSFVGGFILNFMPCVFPVLGIKLLGFVAQAGGERRKVTWHGLSFTMGVLLSFWILAGALAVLRASGAQLGWGFQLQSPPFVFVLAVIMLVFALSLSGVFDVGLRASGIGSQLQMRNGYSGSFFAGMLATVVSTPCSAPFLAPALGAALVLPTSESLVAFSAMAAGLSAPLLLISAFPDCVTWLPKPGRWMETLKQLMAFPLYATVAYLMWVLAGQTSESRLLAAFLSFAVIAMAVWLYGRYAMFGASTVGSRVAIAATLALFLTGMYFGWPRGTPPNEIEWEDWSAERVSQLQQQGRWIYVDFTARWCVTCQTNKQVVFGSAAVKKRIREQNIAPLKADWTNSDERITAELAKRGRGAVPFNLIYRPGSTEPVVLPEILTPAMVLERLGSSPQP